MTSISYKLSVQEQSLTGQKCHIALARKDFRDLKEHCADRTNMAGFWKAVLLPISTNSFSNIVQHTFLPLVTRVAVKVKDTCVAFFLALLLLPLDLLSLPIRLITCIPRMIYNSYTTKSKHPLQVYLENAKFPNGFREGYLTIELEKKHKKVQNHKEIRTEEKDTYYLDIYPYEVVAPYTHHSRHILEVEKQFLANDEDLYKTRVIRDEFLKTHDGAIYSW